MKAWGSKKIFRRDELPPLETWQVDQFSGASIQRPHVFVDQAAKVAVEAEATTESEFQTESEFESSALIAVKPLVPMIEHEELEYIKRSTYDSAYQSGYDAGEQSGRDAGLLAGTEDGYKAGHAEGYQAGLMLAEQELVRFNALCDRVALTVEQFEMSMAEPIRDIALAVAQQLTRQSYQTDRSRILQLIREVISGLPELQGPIRIELNPNDLVLVQSLIKDDAVSLQWKLDAVSDIDAGGCRLSTASVEVDLTLPTRWARIVTALGSDVSWAADDGHA